MEQLEGFEIMGKEDYVYLLKKSLMALNNYLGNGTQNLTSLW
jgi:hypothetical protein